jgi:anti-sigma factor RsiW
VKLLRGRDLVCRQAVELMTDYLEGRLSRADRRRFEGHLGRCPHCTEYLAQLRETIRLARQPAPPEELPQVLRDDLIQLFRQWQAEQ